MVFVVNAQEKFTSAANLAQMRNRPFTAITRSKAWVRVTGVGEEMDALIAEFERIKANNFALDFTYPTEEERAKLRIVHRDKSQVAKKIQRHERSLVDLVSDLERGEDGAMVQMRYAFSASTGQLLRSSASFLPSPDLTPYQDDPELYITDQVYGEIVDPRVVPVPLQVDFDGGASQDLHHPHSHLMILN